MTNETDGAARLKLLRLPAGQDGLGAFGQYLPHSFHAMALDPQNICVGAVFDSLACGAAVAQRGWDGCRLRYVFIDPKARLCGLGTYLLAGLAGLAAAEGETELSAVYSAGMFEGGTVSGCLLRAGFSPPEAISTEFTAPLSAIVRPEGRLPEGLRLLLVSRLEGAALEGYLSACDSGAFPAFADPDWDDAPLYEPASLCCLDGDVPAGVLLLRRREDGLYLQGVYVDGAYRRRGVAKALICGALDAARGEPGDTPVYTSVISPVSYAMCARLFDPARAAHETEFKAVCALRGPEAE